MKVSTIHHLNLHEPRIEKNKAIVKNNVNHLNDTNNKKN